jgi:cell division protein FtsQ
VSRPERVRRQVGKARAGGQRWQLAFFALLAAAALGYASWHALADPRFAARVDLVAGNQHETADEIVAAAGIRRGQNAWLLPRRAMERNIETLPWVASATLSVSWPDSVRITVKEREPVARLKLASEPGSVPAYALIDAAQRVLDVTADPTQDADLPLIEVVPPAAGGQSGQTLEDKDIGSALAALQELRALGLQISAVAIAPSTGISATADRNVRVLFGDDDDLAKKAQLFQAIVAKISTPASVAYVDVRSVRAPTVLYR